MHRSLYLLSLISAAALLSSSAEADVLILKDGRILEREKMESTERGVKVHFENGCILVPTDQIRDALLAKSPARTDLTDKEKEKAAKGLVPFEGRWIKPAKRQEKIKKKIAARKAQVEELRLHSLWRNRHKEETKHFFFEYTVPPFVYERYRDVMEAYYKEFAKTWKVRQPKDLGKLKVCFYSDMESFVQIGGAGYGVLGYFKFVKPLELNFYFSRVDPDETEQVMYHEASHYLQKLLDPHFSMPHFPGEAIAEYYGSSQYDPVTKKLTTGLILEGRLTQVKTDIAAGNVLGLEKMILAGRGFFKHYTWGWTLAHFLMNDKRYSKKWVKFVKGLVFDKKVKRISMSFAGLKTVQPPEILRYFRQTLGLKKDEDFDSLEAEWHDYVKNTLQNSSTRGLELAAASAARSGRRPIRAKRLFKEAIEAGSDNPLTFYKYGQILERDNQRAKAIDQYRKAIELAAVESEFYAALGRALHRKGDKEEGMRFMKLSLELDPDNPWLEDAIARYQEEDAED